MDVPRQREAAENIVDCAEDQRYQCLAERDCQELAEVRITRKDRLGERDTYACAAHRARAEFAVRQRFPGWGEPRLTVTVLAALRSEAWSPSASHIV